jgi:DNA-binding MarR family transcriptional regulator
MPYTRLPEPLRTETQAILDAIRRVVRALREDSRATEESLGLSTAQLFVLQRLRDGGPGSIGELAERTLTHQSSVSAVAARVVQLGLASRSRPADDARRAELSLSAKGRALLRRAPEALQARLITAVVRMKPAERKRLVNLLTHLTEGLDGGPAPMLFEDVGHRDGSKLARPARPRRGARTRRG